MEFKTLNEVNDGESAASPEITCVVHVMKELRTLCICGKGVMVEDSLTNNSHPNPSSL